MKNPRLLFAVCALLPAFYTSHAAALSTSDYMVITEMTSDDGHAFIMSDSEIGAIGENGSTSPPGSLPSLPGGTERTVSTGITLDGDAAITNGGTVLSDSTVQLSNSDVHAVNTGASNPGSQGIDCSSTYAICTDNGSQISSNNRFNQSSPTASFNTLAENNGIQGGIDLSGIENELDNLRDVIGGLSSTSTIDLASGLIENESNLIWDFSGDSFIGLNVIDITTNGNDFSITNSNLTIIGDAGDTIIFRVDPSWTMNVSQSNLLLDGAIGDNNVLWYVDADAGEESFNFNNATFYGMSLWDIGLDTDNVISFNNVQFCGQVITDQVNFQNVSGSACSFDVSAVPIPAAVWLFGSGLIGLIGIARRKKPA
jgi:hypothetical protein